MTYRCDCFTATPFVDFDGDTICTRCRRVLHVGPLGVNQMGPNVGRGHDYAPHGMREFNHRQRNDRRAMREN